MESTTRLCAGCGAALPAKATKRRKYCSDACRYRSNDLAQLQQAQVNHRQEMDILVDQLRKDLARKESQLATARETIAAERTQLRRQEAKARKRERQKHAQAQRAITARVKTLVVARDRLATVTADLESATAGRVNRSDLAIAAQQILDLQNRLTTVTDRYQAVTGQHTQLRDRYETLVTDYNKAAQKLNTLARDRQRFRPVIDAWDTLAGRLANSVPTGQLSPGDREIVRMWATWKAGRDRRMKTGQ